MKCHNCGDEHGNSGKFCNGCLRIRANIRYHKKRIKDLEFELELRAKNRRQNEDK